MHNILQSSLFRLLMDGDIKPFFQLSKSLRGLTVEPTVKVAKRQGVF